MQGRYSGPMLFAIEGREGWVEGAVLELDVARAAIRKDREDIRREGRPVPPRIRHIRKGDTRCMSV